MFRRQIIASAAAVYLCLGNTAIAQTDSAAKQTQSGELIVSTGSTRGSLTVNQFLFGTWGAGPAVGFALFYRKIGEFTGTRTFLEPHISYSPIEIGNAPDFEGHVTGGVTVKHLEPGAYEIYAFNVTAGSLDWWPKEAFSIPFTITAGRATYIGEFACIPQTRKALFGLAAPEIGYFVVSDQHERDIAIAQKADQQLFPVTVSVTDVSTLGLSFLQPKELP
jgi:hypothetical protein